MILFFFFIVEGLIIFCLVDIFFYGFLGKALKYLICNALEAFEAMIIIHTNGALEQLKCEPEMLGISNRLVFLDLET